eukprot:921893-Pyramimonas_sp.AAC.1
MVGKGGPRKGLVHGGNGVARAVLEAQRVADSGGQWASTAWALRLGGRPALPCLERTQEMLTVPRWRRCPGRSL